MKLGLILSFLIILNFIKAQPKADTIILLDYFERMSFNKLTGFGEDALQIILYKDTILLQAKDKAFNAQTLRFSNKLKLYDMKKKEWRSKPIQSFDFYDNIQFSGLRIIKPLDSNIRVQIKSVKTKSISHFNNQAFDTIVNFSSVNENYELYWNVYNFFGDFASKRRPNYLACYNGIHKFSLPTIIEIRKMKSSFLNKSPEDSLIDVIDFEVNLITGKFTEYTKNKR